MNKKFTDSEDPLAAGVQRMVRAHARDGLGELSTGASLAGVSGVLALKLWMPGVALAGWPVMAALMAASFGLRTAVDRIRQRIGPARAGYVGHGELKLKHLLYMAALPMAVTLLGAKGLIPMGLVLVFVGAFMGGLEWLKGRLAGVTRSQALGVFIFLLACAVAALNLGFLHGFLLWTSIQSAVYLATGAWVLWGYLR